VDISDGVFTLLFLFLDAGIHPSCDDAADADDNGTVELTDAIYTFEFLFTGGPSPRAPFSVPGCDRTSDSLDCASHGQDAPCSEASSMIFNHTHADLSLTDVSTDLVEAAKSHFKIWYGHTSHGSQIMSGIEAMRDEIFNYNQGAGTLSIQETGGDLGNPDYTAWAGTTRAKLQEAGNDRNVVMWSWCGQVSSSTEEIIRRDYLGQMDALEAEFPSVEFVYMTGHLLGDGEDGNTHQRNEQIREFCRTKGKILFDFADIESYDPDGNYYLDKDADDGCYYSDGQTRKNWAQEWCAANPGKCSDCSCAHSESLNCDRKARVFWRMMAAMAASIAP
jgi:hypothetical protein